MSNENNEENNFQGGVIYTNNISDVDDDTYKLYQESKSNYDINKLNVNIKSEMELSSITKTDTTNEIIDNEEKLDDDMDNNKLIKPIIEKEDEQKKNEEEEENILLYGNDINNLYPKYLGKMRSFFYIKNQPLIYLKAMLLKSVIINKVALS